jgi:hypothetical protein
MAETPQAALQATVARRLRWQVLLALVAAVVLVGAGARFIWWAKHPSLFNDGATESGPAVVGQLQWVGVTYPDDSLAPTTLHLESVHARIASDTSAASIRPIVCEAPWQAVGETAVGSGSVASQRSLCLQPVTARDVNMTLGRGYRQYLVLEILPTKPGTLKIDRVDVEYSHGLQEGSQSLSWNITMNARR